MFFRPSFCANCGEKIDRPEWFPWTSRRFCQVCEIEFKGQELIPRVIVGLAIVFGLFGIGGYLKSSSPASELQALKQPKRSIEPPSIVTKLAASDSPVSKQENTNGAFNGQPGQLIISSTPGKANGQTLPEVKAPADEQAYYCGAETKKGTPCSRRVKGNTRCFQHHGMPAMASSAKLAVK